MTLVGTIQEIAANTGGYLITLVTGVEFVGPAVPAATKVKVSITTAQLSQFALQGFQRGLDKGTDFLIGVKVQIESDEAKTGGKMPGYKVASSIGFPVSFGSDSADRFNSEQAAGGAVKWPVPNRTSPFTPIPVPYLSLSGASQPLTLRSDQLAEGVEGFRIGYAIVPVNPQHVTHQRSSYIRQATGLRMKDSIKTALGAGYESYSLTYTVDGAYEITCGVRDVFEQIGLTPFVSAEGGPFGDKGQKGVIPYKDMAVRSYGVSTVPGMPGSLQVQIDFDPFIWDWWRPHTEGSGEWKKPGGTEALPGFQVKTLDDAVCYPLFKIWCKTVGRSQYNISAGTLPSEQVLDGSRALNGRMVITIPSAKAIQQIETVLSNPSLPSDGTDKDIARSANGLLSNEYSNVVSDNVKEIVVGSGNRYLVVKLNDPGNFTLLTGLRPTTGPTTGTDGGVPTVVSTDPPGDMYLGLIDWSRISAFKYADSEGNRIPKGTIISANQIPRVRSTILGYSETPGGLVDIPANTPFSEALLEWLIAREQEDDSTLTLQQATDNANAVYRAYLAHPEQYFGVLIRVTDANKAKTEQVLGSIASRTNLLYSAGSKNYSDQIFQIFDQPGAIDGTQVLNVKGADEDPDNEPEIIVQQISGVRNHSLSVTSVQGMTLPIHAYMGSMGAVFTVQGHCFGLQAKRRLEQLKEEFDNRAVKKTSPEYDATRPSNEIDLAKKKAGTPFLRIENEIFQLMGCNFVMPVTLTFDTVDGMPDAYQFTLTMIDYDPRINNAERVKYLPTVNQQTSTLLAYGFPTNTSPSDGSPQDNPGYHLHPTIVKARDYFSLQAALRYERLLPDMELPTKSELNRWIESCVKIAKSRLADNGPAVELDAEDLRIQSIINQFLVNPLTSQFATKFMAAWDTTPGPLDGGLYVDPDFYYFYHSEDDFGNMLDTWMKKILGKPTDTLSASSPEGGGMQPSRRAFDTEHDLISVTGPDFIGASVATGPNHLETVWDNTYDTYAGQRALDKQVTEEKIRQERIAVGQSLGWWVAGAGLENLAQGQQTVLLNDQVFSQPLTDTTFIPQATPVDPKEKESFEASKVGEALRPFFSISWRQSQLKKFADAGSNHPQSIDYEGMGFLEGNFLLAVGDDTDLVSDFLFGSDVSNEVKFLAGVNSEHTNKWLVRTDLKQRMLNIDQFSRYVEDILPQRIGSFKFQGPLQEWGKQFGVNPYLFSFEHNPSDSEINELYGNAAGSLTLLATQPSFLERVYLTNQSYAYWRRNRGIIRKSPGGGGIVERQKNLFLTIDAIAAQHNIDPHIVRAFFQVRSGLGANNSPDNTVDAGWGDLDLQSLGLSPSADYTDVVEKFCQVYESYARKFNNITSFALVATDAEMTSKGRDLRTNGVLAFEKSLQTAAFKIGNPKSRQSASAIQQALKELPLGTDLLCLYYTAWVELARMFGPVVDSSIGGDCFFDADNPLIVMDVARGFKPSVWGDNLSFETSFAPCAKGTLIRASRGITGESKLVNLSKDTPQISAEARATMLGRNRIAISPASEDSIYGMLHDFRKYAPHGRLIGAFPAYLILFINEGFYWQGGGQKLWDQYYTRTAVTAIEVFRSRNNPGDVATVTLSNVFHQLTRYAAQEALLHDLSLREKKVFQQRVESLGSAPGAAKTFGDLWSEFVLKNPSEALKKIWQKNFFNVLVVGAGARLHIRMGYGSDASKLPVLFNGTIVEAPVDEGAVTVMAVGDGAELEKPSVNKLYKSANGYAYVDQGLLGTGKSPSNIVTEALINLEGMSALLAKATGGSYFRDWSHGITHFGDIYLDGLVHHPAETQINLYDSALTSFEQGVPAIKNYFITHALYDWNGENTWFSVDVSEPTPWKVIEVCRHAVSDFVASAEPIMTQSTVFFGRWWWPFNYAWAPSILDVGKTLSRAKELKNQPPNKPGEKTSIIKKPVPPTNPIDTIPLMNGSDRGWLKDATKSYDVLSASQIGVGNIDEMALLRRAGLISREQENDARSLGNLTFYSLTLQDDQGRPFIAVFYLSNVGGHLESAFPNGFAVLPDEARNSPQQMYSGLKQSLGDAAAQELITTDQRSTSQLANQAYDSLKDVNFLVSHMIWKPFMQIYMAHSHLNLLSVNIKADSTNVYTDAIGLHTYHGFFSGDAVERNASWCVDDNIQPAERKTMMVNTGILLTAFEAGLPGLRRKVAGWVPGLSDFVNEVPPTPAIENSVISALVDSVKEMYQGWFTITGTPSMKPRDLVLLSDIKSGLSGPVWVKEVIHRMDGQVGFITMVSPDCVAVPHSSLQGYRMLATMATNVGFQFMAWWSLRQIMQATKLGMASYGDKAMDAERMYYRMIREELEEFKLGTYMSFKENFNNDVENIRQMLQHEGLRTDPGRVVKKGFDPQKFAQQTNSKLSALQREYEAGSISEKEATRRFKEIVGEVSEHFPTIAVDQHTFAQLERLSTTTEEQKQFLKEAEELKKSIRPKIVAELFEVDENGEIVRDALGNGVIRNKYIPTDPQKLEQIISDLEHDEWIKFLKKNRKVVESIGLNAVHTEEVMKRLTALEATVTDPKKLKELRALKEALAKQKLVLTIEDFEDLHRILHTPIAEYFELTQKNQSVFRQLLEANKSYNKVLNSPTEGIGKIVGNLLGKGRDTETVAKDFTALTKLKAMLANIGEAAKKLKKGREGYDEVKESIKLASLATKIERGIKDGIMAARVASYAGPQAILSIVKDVVWFCIGDSIVDAINQHLKARHSVKVIPLHSGAVPYVAGIRGHQGAVIGDDPGWLDNILMDWVGGKGEPGSTSNFAKNSTHFLAGFVGIQVPDWTPSPSEQQYLRSLKEQNELDKTL